MQHCLKTLSAGLVAVCAVLSASATYTSADYVQKGLLACWDGCENAGRGIHNPSATVWRDVIGGREFALTGVTVADDRMVFAGTASSYGLMGASGTRETFEMATNGTLEVVYASATGTGDQIILQSSTKSGIVFSFYQTSKLVTSVIKGKVPGFDYGSSTATNRVSVRYTSALPTDAIAGDGTSLSWTGTTTYYWGSVADKTTIGTRNSKENNHFNGAIYCIRVYSRRLTDAEIAANHAIDEARFNPSGPEPVYSAPVSSDSQLVYLRKDTSSFWHTATNRTMTLPVEFPAGASSASLTIAGAFGYSQTIGNITGSSVTVTLPEATMPRHGAATEDVYDFTLTFNNDVVRTAKLGLIAGLGEGATRCLAPVSEPEWEKVRGQMLVPIPYGMTSFEIDGVATDTGLNGDQGWYTLKLKSNVAATLTALVDDKQWAASLLGAASGFFLIVR